MSSGLCETDPIWDWVPTILLSDFRALLFFLSKMSKCQNFEKMEKMEKMGARKGWKRATTKK